MPRQGFISIGGKLSILEPLKNGKHFIFKYVCIWMIVTICPDLASCEAQIQSHHSFMSIRLQFSSMMEPALDDLS